MPNLREQLQKSLAPSYIIERELGGGGMSLIFLAEETRLGRRVAIKVLSQEIADEIDTAGSAVVVDFGIAKAISISKTHAREKVLTGPGTAVGTAGYMAPEQAAGEPDVDHHADIYTWGLVAYELL